MSMDFSVYEETMMMIEGRLQACWSTPAACQHLTVNMANGNARHMMVVLGYEPDDLAIWEPADLLARIGRAERTLAGSHASELCRSEMAGVGAAGACWWEAGLDREGVARRLADIKAIALEAQWRGLKVGVS